MTHQYISSAVAVFIRAAVFLLLTCVAALAAFLYWQHNAIRFYSEALRAAHVEDSVVIRGTVYLIADGAVQHDSEQLSVRLRHAALRTAYEKTAARRAPFVALAGTPPDAMRAAIHALEDAQITLAEAQDSQKDALVVADALYPIAFLTAVADLEAARLSFLGSGSDTDARRYAEALQHAFDQYGHDIGAFERAFKRIIPESMPAYATEASILKRTHALQMISDLAAGAEREQRASGKRALCFMGLTFMCADDLAFASILPVEDRQITAEESARATTISALLIRGSVLPRGFSRPLVALSSSACLRADRAPLFILDADASPLRTIFFAGDMRFVESGAHTNVPFYRYFAERSVRYVPNSPLSYYECPAFGSDWGRVFATEAVRRFAAQESVSQYAVDAEQSALRSLEQSLASTSMIKESDSIAYIRAGIALAERGALPKRTSDAIASLSLQIRNRSAGFDALIAAVAASEVLHVAHENAEVPRSNDAVFLFFTRSAFLPLFLSHNPSLTSARAPEAHTGSRSDEPFVWLSSMPSTAALTEELIEAIDFFMHMPTS